MALFPLVGIIYALCIPPMFLHYIWISIRNIVDTVIVPRRSYYNANALPPMIGL